MRALDVRPFPLDRIARVTRADAALLRDTLRRAPPDLRRFCDTLGARTDVPVRVASRSVHLQTCDSLARRLAPRVIAFVFDRIDGTRAVLDLDAPIASVLAERILGGDGDPAACPTAEHLGGIERGLVAAALVEALVASDAPTPSWRLSCALDSAAGVVESLRSPLRVVVIVLDVHVGAAVGQARLLLPESTSLRLPATESLAPGAFARIAGLTLELRGLVGRARLSARELASLSVSDVVVLDHATVRRVAGTSEVEGRVAVTIRGATRPITWATVQSRALVRAIEEGHVPTSSEEITTDQAARELLGEQPVEVTVEIARAVLRADELMALRAGEIVRTGAPVTAEVRMFAAGRLVARGELVDVEGEVGVRLLQTY